MSADIIQIAAFARAARPAVDQVTATIERIVDNRLQGLTPSQRRRAGRPELPPPATETAKNARIRVKCRDAWWHAGRVVSYWKARLDWQSALECAQEWGIADSASFPAARGIESRWKLVDTWREAIAKQLLTPAPDLAAITWKRAKLKSSDFPHLPVKAPRVEQAIADDVAFLEAHPTRKPSGKPCKKPGPKGKMPAPIAPEA
jgi:hypothetical protein